MRGAAPQTPAEDDASDALRETRLLWLILLVGLLLRLAFALSQPTLAVYTNESGGDSGWFLAVGAGLLSGREHGWIHGVAFYNGTLPTPPLYPLFLGAAQQPLPEHAAIIVIRVLQCLASIATAYIAFRLASLLFRQRRAGLIAAALLAFHPVMIREPALIATECLYIFFIALGLWLYAEYFAAARAHRQRHALKPTSALILSALALALATLTRAVSIAFPLLVAAHLWLLGRRRRLPSWKRACLLLLAVYAALLSTWTIHNLALWDRFVIVSDQGLPALWRGAESDDGSPRQNDKLLLDGREPDVPVGCAVDCKYQHPASLYLERIRDIVQADLGQLIALRLGEWAGAVLQPHGTTGLGDISIRTALGEWLENDRSGASLAAMTNIEGFAAKLAVWILHAVALAFGPLGIIRSRRAWTVAMPLAGFVCYTLGAHLFLLALPRYIFPIETILLVFASGPLAAGLDTLAARIWRGNRESGGKA